MSCTAPAGAVVARPTSDPGAIATQRTRLTELERSRAALDAAQSPSTGNFFRARVVPIDDQLPKLAEVEATIATYSRAVNEHNRVEYASLRAPAAPPGTAHYVGNESCRECHEEAYDVWARTTHAHAYHTLEVVSKNFNLSCVGCHVTGYRQPGGSEVVQNEGLRDVGCESCHGPGSLHNDARGRAQRVATIRRTVNGDFCAHECHTREHSDQFNFDRYLPHILGPGHGRPLDDTSDAGPLFPTPRTDGHHEIRVGGAEGCCTVPPAPMRPPLALALCTALSLACVTTRTVVIGGGTPVATKALSGQASYYSDSLAGNTTANGETYDPGALTAAHRTLPFGTRLRVRRINNGREVEVRVNDRGPFGHARRIIDLSRAAATALHLFRPASSRWIRCARSPNLLPLALSQELPALRIVFDISPTVSQLRGVLRRSFVKENQKVP